jgi:MoxR-like ATPase
MNLLKLFGLGAGPRASQNLILAAKANAAFNGKFSPDIEDVKRLQ